MLYSVSELGDALDLTRHMTQSLLRAQGVISYRIGPVTLVPLGEIKDKLEPVFDAICLAEHVKSQAAAMNAKPSVSRNDRD